MEEERPLEVIMGFSRRNRVESHEVAELRIRALEQEVEGLDLECEEDGEANMLQMENICNEISLLEEGMNHQENGGDDVDSDIKFKAVQVLEYFGITHEMQKMAMGQLSGGQKKKVLLACTLFCDLDLLLLDGK